MLCLSEPNLYKFALSLFLLPVKAKNSEDKGMCVLGVRHVRPGDTFEDYVTEV